MKIEDIRAYVINC